MSAWGGNGAARSCDALMKRVEANDPALTELVILPLKTFGSKDVRRLVKALPQNSHLTSLQASGHPIDDLEVLEELGKALSTLQSSLVDLAVGDSSMGDDGVSALCRGLQYGNKLSLRRIDLSWKNM
jgi:cell division inhibitor SulA